MSRQFTVAVAVLFVAALPSLASEPGQPIDCTDFVFLEPGHGCQVFAPRPCDLNQNPVCNFPGPTATFDNQRRLLAVRTYSVPGGPNCTTVNRVEIYYSDGNSRGAIAYVDGRCPLPGVSDDVYASSSWVAFDPISGSLLVGLHSSCNGPSPTCSEDGPAWIASISGFATSFDVLQTYAPSTSSIGFRVPHMPDGFPAADHFDTYWGPLPGPIDFTQSHSLQCNYPASPPHVGDYFTVADSLPNPSAGHGYYYVTAATYQGQSRYGRKGSRGVLTGRDPTLLPACVQPQP